MQMQLMVKRSLPMSASTSEETIASNIVDDNKIIARIDELARICPGNPLVWEFLALKEVDRAEVEDRLQVMFDRQCDYACNPCYIEEVHHDGFNTICRGRVVQLYLEVILNSESFFLPKNLHYLFQLNLASETIGVAVNLLDRFLAEGSRTLTDIKLIAVTALVMASKLHGRTLTSKEFIASGVKSFTAQDVAKMEMTVCMKLDWKLAPVTPYEIMKYLVLYSAAPGRVLRELIIFSQIFIDCTLCEYSALKYTPVVVAISGVLLAHKRASHCPRQWLNAIKELGLHPAQDEEVIACCSALRNRFDFASRRSPRVPGGAHGTGRVDKFFQGCRPVTPSLQATKKHKNVTTAA
jgi:hypothetical protein